MEHLITISADDNRVLVEMPNHSRWVELPDTDDPAVLAEFIGRLVAQALQF